MLTSLQPLLPAKVTPPPRHDTTGHKMFQLVSEWLPYSLLTWMLSWITWPRRSGLIWHLLLRLSQFPKFILEIVNCVLYYTIVYYNILCYTLIFLIGRADFHVITQSSLLSYEFLTTVLILMILHLHFTFLIFLLMCKILLLTGLFLFAFTVKNFITVYLERRYPNKSYNYYYYYWIMIELMNSSVHIYL